jgi:alpha-L-rhamnosidase
VKRRDFLKTASASFAAQFGARQVRAAGQEPEKEAASGVGLYPTKLRCESRTNPLGIDALCPRLSWILVSAGLGERNQKQSAYHVLVASSLAHLRDGNGDLWDTGKVISDQSIQLAYSGTALASTQRAWWKVKVWDQDGHGSPWSAETTWSMGLLRPTDWEGKWIGLEGGDEAPEEFRGAHWIAGLASGSSVLRFRRVFTISEENPLSYGQLAAVGSGEVSVFVNGSKVMVDLHRTPREYVVQAVTSMLHPGRNVVAIKVQTSSPPAAILAGVTLDLSHGQILRIATDESWKVSDKEVADWEKPEFDDANWEDARITPSLPLPKSVMAGERTRLPARMVRKEFQLAEIPQRATAYISGLGYYEMYVNGQKVGDDVLAPALTDYDKRIFYRTYDVTALLRLGGNAVGILLGNGRFFAPRRYIPFFTRNFGYPKALLQLEIEVSNGERIRIKTDASWKVTDQGPIRANNVYDGEEYDARLEQIGWATVGFRDVGWPAAQIVDSPHGKLCAQASDPIRVMREIKPLNMTQPEPGVFVFDMGQNMVGWCRMQVSGPAGTRISLRHAEVLRPDGHLYLDNLRSARQMDVYTLHGDGAEVYEPRFTSHGFQYVELRGFPGTPSRETLTGRVVNDAMEEHPDFATSSEVINHIYQNILWGDRGNYHSIPTDCPQRDERQGWLGDRSAECMGESYMFDVSNFYAQWVDDIADTMDIEGRINDVAPAYWPIYNDNVVWPASFFLVAKMLHRQYGDVRVIEKHYPAMKRWIAYMRGLIQDDLMPVDIYGDWCVPPKSLTLIHSTAPAVLGTTYFYSLLRLMSEFAVISGNPEDRKIFDDLASRMKAAFNSKYFRPESAQYDNGTQTSSVLALAFGMAPENQRKAIFDALLHKIDVETKGHLGTGLVGGQWLMQTLTDNGSANVAYQIASETTYPSWGYMIPRGATTIWELWNGDTANPAMNSRNHLMLVGDLCTWFYENLAGIQADPDRPGFKHIMVRPRLAGDLKFVHASHMSPYGKITTDWNRDGMRFTLRVSIPPNVTATIYIPSGAREFVREGGKAAEASKGVHFSGTMPGTVVFEVGSGEYTFASLM